MLKSDTRRPISQVRLERSFDLDGNAGVQRHAGQRVHVIGAGQQVDIRMFVTVGDRTDVPMRAGVEDGSEEYLASLVVDPDSLAVDDAPLGSRVRMEDDVGRHLEELDLAVETPTLGDFGRVGQGNALERGPHRLKPLDLLLQGDRPVVDQLLGDPCEDPVILTRGRLDVPRRHFRGLGRQRIEGPDFPSRQDRLHPLRRIEHAGIVGVADHRIGTDVDQQLDRVIVGSRHHGIGAAHCSRQHRFGAAIIRQRRKFRWPTERGVKGLHHRIARRIDSQPAAEVHADRLRPVGIDFLAQLLGDVVEGLIPADFRQHPVFAHHWFRDRVRSVQHLTDHAAFRTGIALADGVLKIALHFDDFPIVEHIDGDAANRGANPAIRALGFYLPGPSLVGERVSYHGCHLSCPAIGTDGD